MIFKLLIIGKTVNTEIEYLVENYKNRLRHYCKCEVEYLVPKRQKKRASVESVKSLEGELILNRIMPESILVILDEKGKPYSSAGFSNFIQKLLLSGKKEVIFCIGGAYGFDSKVYERADHQVSLSKMTFTHQMVRLIFIEQLYRAFTILKGEKYHH